MPWVNPSTRATGYLVTASNWNTDVVANTKFLHGPPTARVRATTNSTLANNVWASVPFQTEDWDSDTMFSSTSNRKVICRTAGKFQVDANAGFNGSSAGAIRAIAIQKNTTTAGSGHEYEMLVSSTALGNSTPTLHCGGLVALTTGQFVRIEMFQDSGAGLQTSTAPGRQPTLSVIWMSS